MGLAGNIELWIYRHRKNLIRGVLALLALGLIVLILLWLIPQKRPDTVTPMLQDQEKELQKQLNELENEAGQLIDSIDYSRTAWLKARDKRFQHDSKVDSIDMAASAVRTARELAERLSAGHR